MVVVMSGEYIYAVLRRIRPVHELSARAVTAALAGSDITMPMRAVLEQLYDAGPLTVPAIARRLFVTRQGVQVLVDEAKRLGYTDAQIIEALGVLQYFAGISVVINGLNMGDDVNESVKAFLRGDG